MSLNNMMWSAVIFCTVFFTNLSANDTLQVDLDSSQINWTGRKVTGEHTGTLNLSTGWVVMDKNKESCCLECGEECHCKEETDKETCCPSCECIDKAMDRDGSA